MERKKNEKISRKERETQLRKEFILEASEKLFLSKGYEETTMDEIALEAEFSKGTVYKYFASKDELYIAIGCKAYKLIIKYTKEFIEKEKEGMKQLMAIGYAFYEFSKAHPNFASIFHDIAVKLPNLVSKPKTMLSVIEKEYLNLSNSYRELFVGVLNDALKLKAIRADQNPFMIGYILSTLTRGLIEDLMQSKDVVKKKFGLDPDDVINFAFEMIGEGLKPRE